MEKHVSKLISRIQAGDTSGEASSALLEEFYAGLDLEILKSLIGSDKVECVKAGAFILSELPHVAGSFIPNDLLRLLAHEDPWVRNDALNIVLTGTQPDHGFVLGKALQALWDENKGVRLKAMDVARRLSLQQLEAALSASESLKLSKALHWLLYESDTENDDDFVQRIDGPDHLNAAITVVAAARVGAARTSILEHTIRSRSDELADLAQYAIEDLHRAITGYSAPS